MSDYFKNLWCAATNNDAMHLIGMASKLYTAALRKEASEGFVVVTKKDGSKHKARYRIEPVTEETKP